jgi:hypothetical protein
MAGSLDLASAWTWRRPPRSATSALAPALSIEQKLLLVNLSGSRTITLRGVTRHKNRQNKTWIIFRTREAVTRLFAGSTALAKPGWCG